MNVVETLARLEDELELPYPERALVLEEIASDLDAAVAWLRAQGLGEPAAEQAAVESAGLTGPVLDTLEAIHRPAVQRVLARLPPPAREWLEAGSIALPFAAASAAMFMEVPVLRFLIEGGPAIWVVLLTGVVALLLEGQRAMQWFVVRDHSAASLRRNTATPLYLAGAALALGVLGTALDYYVVIERWAKGELSEEMLRAGLGEPLPCVIVGSLLATLILFVHALSQARLRAIRIPEPKLA